MVIYGQSNKKKNIDERKEELIQSQEKVHTETKPFFFVEHFSSTVIKDIDIQEEQKNNESLEKQS